MPDNTEDELLSDWWAVQGKQLPRMPEDVLRAFVLGVLGNRIFTSEHIERRPVTICPECNESHPPFPSKTCPDCGTTLVETLGFSQDIGLIFLPLAMGALSDWPKDQLELIGCFWAYHHEAFPRSINGYPMFPSVRMMHRDDWARAAKALAREQQRQQDIEV